MKVSENFIKFVKHLKRTGGDNYRIEKNLKSEEAEYMNEMVFDANHDTRVTLPEFVAAYSDPEEIKKSDCVDLHLARAIDVLANYKETETIITAARTINKFNPKVSEVRNTALEIIENRLNHGEKNIELTRALIQAYHILK